MSRLKPCPFCGGEVRLRYVNDDMEYCCFDDAEDKSQEEGFHIHCYNCDSDFYHDEPIDIINKTIEWWNTRKPMDKVVKQLGERSQRIKPVGWVAYQEVIMTKEVLDIVKAGGTDE